MKKKFIRLYMDLVTRISKESYAERLKVGAIIVKGGDILSYSYNGTLENTDNCCEIKKYLNKHDSTQLTTDEILTQYPLEDENGRYVLETKPDVIHAEEGALLKLAKHGKRGRGATMFLTHNPCIQCATRIKFAGIKKVIYKDNYRCDSGIKKLKKVGVKVIQYKNI